jgi:hypothetical protein
MVQQKIIRKEECSGEGWSNRKNVPAKNFPLQREQILDEECFPRRIILCGEHSADQSSSEEYIVRRILQQGISGQAKKILEEFTNQKFYERSMIRYEECSGEEFSD